MPILIQSGRFGAPAFSPLSLSPRLWFDPSDASSVTLNGSDVSQLNDKSGNTTHATQGTAASQPAYATAAFNGLNVLNYAGASTEVLATANITLAQPVTILMIVKRSETSNTGIQCVGLNSNNPTILSWSNWQSFSGGFLNTGVSSADTNAHQLTVVFDGASSIFRLDGAQIGAGNPNTNGWSTVPFLLGNNSSGTGRWNGYIGETILCPAVVSGTPLTNCESYLKAKWGTI